MTAIYTEDTLRALNKTQLIKLFLKSQEHTKGIINSLTEEMKNLNENFKKLESDVAVVKNVNNILCKQIVSVERQCWKNAQYSRRECVEVVGLPSSIADDQLENTICRVLQHIGANITNEKIESCHRLNKNADRTIVKFLRRKDCEQVMRVKSELKKLKPADLDLSVGTKLYINESLCPYYRGLWNQCKKLWNRRKLFSFFTVNGSVRVKLQENGSYNIITHIDDLKEIFPEEDFTMF